MRMKLYPSETYIKPLGQYLIDNFQDKETLIGVEIGVAQGFHALGLLSNLKNLKKLYLIDPYLPYVDRRNKEYRKGSMHDFLTCFKSIILDNPLFNDRYVLLKNYSEFAVSSVPDDIDFVYIDGNHDYGYVRKDIELYYPKVKKGGVFGGDDYYKSEVKSAVDEFIIKYGYELYTKEYLTNSGKNKLGYISNCEWWIIKNE